MKLYGKYLIENFSYLESACGLLYTLERHQHPWAIASPIKENFVKVRIVRKSLVVDCQLGYHEYI